MMGLPRLTVNEAVQYELHEADEWLPGRIVDIEETESDWGSGLKWIIVLDDDEPNPDGSDRETWAFSSQKVSPKSKTYKWAAAILGEMPEAGDELDLNLLLQKPIEVFFEQVESDEIDRSTGKAIVKEKVEKIRAAKKAVTRVPAKASPPPRRPVRDVEPF